MMHPQTDIITINLNILGVILKLKHSVFFFTLKKNLHKEQTKKKISCL